MVTARIPIIKVKLANKRTIIVIALLLLSTRVKTPKVTEAARYIIPIIIIPKKKKKVAKAATAAAAIASARLEAEMSIPKLKRTNNASASDGKKTITKIVIELKSIIIPATIFRLSTTPIL